jgi:hypothetical protein
VFVTNVPAVQGVIKVIRLGGREWVMAFAVPFVAIFWQELRKIKKPLPLARGD